MLRVPWSLSLTVACSAEALLLVWVEWGLCHCCHANWPRDGLCWVCQSRECDVALDHGVGWLCDVDGCNGYVCGFRAIVVQSCCMCLQVTTPKLLLFSCMEG